MGASYTIYEKNWTCRQCKYEKNYGNHLKCTRCKAKKPQVRDDGTHLPHLPQSPLRTYL